MSIINFCETDRKLRERVDELGLSESRKRTTNIVFTEIYTEFDLTPSELLEKAREDEEQYIENHRIKQKPLDDRIVSEIQSDYKYYLDNKTYRGKKLLPNTILLKLNIYRAFLKYYGIELPKKQNITVPKSRINDEDIPSWDDVYDALPNCKSPRDKAIVAMAATSGLRISDILSRKICHLIEACDIYFEDGEERSLDNLLKKDPSQIIPCWELVAKKVENSDENNNSLTITFNTPECTEFIFKYLQYRIDLNIKNKGNGKIEPDEALFKSQRNTNEGGHLDVHSISYQFSTLNKKLGDKKQKNNVYGKFSSHGLRKLFKTTCRRKLPEINENADKIFIGDVVSLFTGHASKENSIDDFYVAVPKDSEDSYLRKTYQELVPYLSIRPTEVKDFSTEEYKKLQAENDEIRQNYEELENSMDRQKEEYEKKIRRLEALNDVLSEKVGSIENQVQNIARGNDINRLIEYANNDELVQRHNLNSDVIQIYLEEIERNPNLYLNDNQMDIIIKRALNNRRFNEVNQNNNPSQPKTKYYEDILNSISQKAKEIMSEYRIHLVDLQKEELNTQLSSYALKIDNILSKSEDTNWEDEIDENKIYRLVFEISKHMHLS